MTEHSPVDDFLELSDALSALGFWDGGAVDEGRMVRVGATTLFVRELGVRRPPRTSLLVLHGGPDVGHRYLLPGIEPLEPDHHVVLFDFRGCGLSSRGLPEDALQPENVVDDAHELIGTLDLGPVDVLGFSTGGRTAVELVRRFPGDVRRLIVASASAYPAGDAETYLRDWTEPRRRRALEDAAGGTLQTRQRSCGTSIVRPSTWR